MTEAEGEEWKGKMKRRQSLSHVLASRWYQATRAVVQTTPPSGLSSSLGFAAWRCQELRRGRGYSKGRTSAAEESCVFRSRVISRLRLKRGCPPRHRVISFLRPSGSKRQSRAPPSSGKNEKRMKKHKFLPARVIYPVKNLVR